MTKKKEKQHGDDKAFVILTISRNEVRDICGEAAKRLNDEDMQRLADEMAEYCFDDNFVEALRETVAEKFSDSAEDEED